jgi:transcriptional regulator with XRE-family HTH domain
VTDQARAADPERVGQALRDCREARQMSLRSLARELHLGPSTLSDYERGRRLPPEGVLRACERILELRAGELTEPTQTPSPSHEPPGSSSDAPSSALAPQGTSAMPDAAVTAEAPPPSQPPAEGSFRPRRAGAWSRRIWWTHTLAAAAVGAVVALAAQDLPGLLWPDGSPQRGVASPASVHPTSPGHAVPVDDRDPGDTGCDGDAINLSAVDIDVPDRPDHIVIGQAVARYSPSCATVWARFDPTAAMRRLAPHARLTLTATRPVDRRRLTYTGDYVNTFAWGNMLLSSTGCVTVTVTVTASSLPGPATASTPCLTGAGSSSAN